jgi:hypothetical protein
MEIFNYLITGEDKSILYINDRNVRGNWNTTTCYVQSITIQSNVTNNKPDISYEHTFIDDVILFKICIPKNL